MVEKKKMESFAPFFNLKNSAIFNEKIEIRERCKGVHPIFPFSSFQPFLFIGGFDSSVLCRSRRELSKAYFLAKFGFDAADNEHLTI